MIVLIYGLPGSGKTTLAKKLVDERGAVHINADEVRARFDDWDFSKEGRNRQAQRMMDLAKSHTDADMVVVDFVCPFRESRLAWKFAYRIWMNTITSGRFADTNAIFQAPQPDEFELEICDWDYDSQESLP